MPDIFVSPEKLSLKSQPKPKKVPILSQALSTFLFLPEDVRFDTQAPVEMVILLLRKHWITNLSWLITTFILIVTPIIIFPLVSLSSLIPKDFPFSYVTFIILGWYLVTFSYLLVNFLLWYFTVSIVTTERVIDIDYLNILHRKYAETRIEKIEDVTEKTGGFIRSFFSFGDVYVQTAAKEARFQFFDIPHPQRVVQIINELMGRTEEGGI